MINKPSGQNMKSYWIIGVNVAHTMQQSMRINLQNIKENRQKLASALPPGAKFLLWFQNWPINRYDTPLSYHL